MRKPRPLEIAVIGMGCRFPGASDLRAFWANVLSGRDCTREVPPDRWGLETFYGPDSPAHDRVACRRGGYLDTPVPFDPSVHGIMPRTVEGGEPEQFLVLDAARAALEDAGLGPDALPRRVEVVIGRGNYFNRGNLLRLQHGRIVAQTVALLSALHPKWSADDRDALRRDLQASLPPFEAATVPGQLTNATAGRLADRLDLAGASFVVDAASASSLVAIDLGCRALRERRADLAIVGGVYAEADVDFPLVFRQLDALSRSGHSRPFSRDADGLVPGEGVGVVVLRRLRDAERAGDRVYAVIRGVGVASDGRARGLAAPSARGHARAIRRAYRSSGIDPGSVALIEGHGLGLPLADRAELKALGRRFPRRNGTPRTLGAVSSQIGHAMPAAGMAGFLKAALALHHRVLPSTRGADRPHPAVARAGFRLLNRPRPWIHGDSNTPRRAGVNAFGFAGINAHVVLEEHTASADGLKPGAMTDWDAEAFLLGDSSRIALADRVNALAGRLRERPDVALKNLAFTLNTDPAAFRASVRIGLVASSREELIERLAAIEPRLRDPACHQVRDARGVYFWERPAGRQGGVAFLFPGEGSQYPGMLADLCPHFPELRAVLDRADRIALESGDCQLPSTHLFDEVAGGSSDGLFATDIAVNAVLSTQWALYQVLRRLKIEPQAVVGHSSGELAALAASGAIDAERNLEHELSRLGAVFRELERSGAIPAARLVAIGTHRERIEAACRAQGGSVAIAIDNCPHQVVIGGPDADVAAVVAALQAEGVLCEELPFARAYHAPAFAAVIEPLERFYHQLAFRAPALPIYSCTTASRMPQDPEAIRSLAVSQWTLPVRFRETVERLHADGLRVFVDVGARGNLCGSVEDTLRGREAYAVAVNQPRRSGTVQLEHMVASLYAQGIDLDPAYLYARRRPVRVELDEPAPSARLTAGLELGFPEMRLSPAMRERLRAGEVEGTAPAAVQELRKLEARCKPFTITPSPLVGEGQGGGTDFLGGDRAHTHTNPPPPEGRELDGGRSEDIRRVLPIPDPPTPTLPHTGGGSQIPALPPCGGRLGWGVENKLSGRATSFSYTLSDFWDSLPADELSETDSAMLDYLSTMDAFLQMQHQVLSAYFGNSEAEGDSSSVMEWPAATSDQEPVPGPWAGAIIAHEAGWSVVTRYQLDLDDPVARNHTLGGRRVSAIDPERLGLSVLPFAVMAEMVAQVGALLVPIDLVLTQLEDLRAYRWVSYGVEATALEMRGRVLEDDAQGEAAKKGGQLSREEQISPESQRSARSQSPFSHRHGVRVAIHTIAATGDVSERPVFEGTARFAPRRMSSSMAEPLVLSQPRRSRFTAEQLYREQWLFHGPPFQALTEVGAWSEDGVSGTIRVLPQAALLRPGVPERFHIDAIALDVFTHLLGCWGLDCLAQGGDVIFPLRLGTLMLHDPAPAIGTSVSCRIRARAIEHHRVRVDADLVRPDGRVWMSLRDWEDWRFYWPNRYRDVFRAPDAVLVGEPLDLSGIDPREASAVWLEPPGDMGRPVWRDVLEETQLAPDERARGRSLTPDSRRTSYLWGRMAAKEAVRRIARARGAAPQFPADLRIESDANGRPILCGVPRVVFNPCSEGSGTRVRKAEPVAPPKHDDPPAHLLGPENPDWPAISIAHTKGVAVALAARGRGERVGIDVELIQDRSASFEELAFTPSERALLDAWQEMPRAARITRFWCAKEAAAKATGLGSRGVPAHAEVRRASNDGSELTIHFQGPLATACADLPAGAILVYTAVRGPFAWAWTLGEPDTP